MNRKGDFIQTFSGKVFWPLDPRPEEVDIVDIAHSLSLMCRFGGHIREFYSVAQHSVLVASLLPDELKLAGLLHDATEGYLVDLPRPVKQWIQQYREIEHNLEKVIAAAFDVSFSDPLIKQADNIMLLTEARDLLGPQTYPWSVCATPADFVVSPWAPSHAEIQFTAYFNQLTSRRKMS